MVEIAVDALDQSLTRLVDGLVGPSSCLAECSEMHTFTYPCSQALKPEGDRKRGPYTYDVEPQAGEKAQAPSAFWRDHYKDMGDAQYRSRFQHEMDVLRKHGTAGYLHILNDVQESQSSNVHIGTCQIRETGTCTCSENNRVSYVGNNIPVPTAYLEAVGEPTPPVPGSPRPRVTDWDSYDECEYCEVPPGMPCIYTVGSPFHDAVNTRQYPHPSRKLISQEKESDSLKLDEATHATPPVPTPPHTQQQVISGCPNCHAPQDCTRRGKNCACCKSRAPLTSESSASCSAKAKTIKLNKKLCYRGNACKNPGHSAVANCIMEVDTPQDPEKQKALIEEDARQAKIIHDQFAKAGILVHWGHTDPCDFGPVCNVCPWCGETMAYDEIHSHTVKHNQAASACPGCKHCDHDPHCKSCLACDVAKPIVTEGEFEIVKSEPFPDGYVKFDILGVPFAKKIEESIKYPCCRHCGEVCLTSPGHSTPCRECGVAGASRS